MIKQKCNKHTKYCSERCQEINEKRSFFTESPMDKYTEISHFLRDFMKNDRYGGGDSYRDTDQITCADDQSINEIMDTISDQIHDSERMDVFLGDRHMAMIPTDDFFRDQAKKNSSKNP